MLCVSLSACSTAKVTTGTIPEQGLTVGQLYKHASLRNAHKLITRDGNHKASVISVVKSIKGERIKKENSFKALPNPEIAIHVFAHVANIGDEQIIKPAYTTRFFLYKQNQYALASELY